MTQPVRQAELVPLDNLATRISHELEKLLSLSLAVQDAMSLRHSLHPENQDVLTGLQGIDRITQGLCDLARLMEEIGVRAPEDVFLERVPLDRRLTLRDLSSRLLPEQVRDRSAHSELASASGEVMLF